MMKIECTEQSCAEQKDRQTLTLLDLLTEPEILIISLFSGSTIGLLVGAALYKYKSNKGPWWIGLRVASGVLAVIMLLVGLVMSAAYLRTHSYPDFECDTFSQEIHVSFNSTTEQFQFGGEINCEFNFH